MTAAAKRLQHRLDGLEPGNLLAFLALLGLLRALEEATPAWLPRVAWSVAELPLRPVLSLSEAVGRDAIVAAAATGIQRLAARHAFGTFKDLKLPLEIATKNFTRPPAATATRPICGPPWPVTPRSANATRCWSRAHPAVPDVRPGIPALPGAVAGGAASAATRSRTEAQPADHLGDRLPERSLVLTLDAA